MRLVLLGLGLIITGAVAAEPASRVAVPQIDGTAASERKVGSPNERATAVPQVTPSTKAVTGRQGELLTTTPLGGKDRCSEKGAPDRLCAETLEKRAAQFPPEATPNTPSEARLLVLSEPAAKAAGAQASGRDLADPNVIAGAAAQQVGRALDGPSGAPAAPNAAAITIISR